MSKHTYTENGETFNVEKIGERWTGSSILDMNTGERWPGIQLKLRDVDSGRECSITFPKKEPAT